MTPSEKLRYVQHRGNLIKQGEEWVWIAAPDVRCEVRELRNRSRWTVIEWVYDALKGIKL